VGGVSLHVERGADGSVDGEDQEESGDDEEEDGEEDEEDEEMDEDEKDEDVEMDEKPKAHDPNDLSAFKMDEYDEESTGVGESPFPV
jgi:periodic tryptophan protein 1